MKTADWSETLPGGRLIQAGLADFQAGRRTLAACLVGIAQTRLSRAGLLPESAVRLFPEPERQLYRLLCEAGGDAYSRYNSLVRELVSFEQSLDRWTRRSGRQRDERVAAFESAVNAPGRMKVERDA